MSPLVVEVNRVQDRKSYLQRRRDDCRARGVCVICQKRPVVPTYVRCAGCRQIEADQNAKRRKGPPRPQASDELEAVPTFFFGDGLPESDPAHFIEWNPWRWDWRTGQASFMTAFAG